MSLIDDLKILLANPPYMKDIFGFWAAETGEWQEGERPAKEAMKRWVRDVEAVLSLAGKREELEIWRESTQVISTDLRAGAALVLAGLTAEGTTEISEVYHIERGYEKFVEKFRGIGAAIIRVEE